MQRLSKIGLGLFVCVLLVSGGIIAAQSHAEEPEAPTLSPPAATAGGEPENVPEPADDAPIEPSSEETRASDYVQVNVPDLGLTLSIPQHAVRAEPLWEWTVPGVEEGHLAFNYM